ncbi:MAG: histidine kinase [Proteobacteria bacterium]|nr:MAG: histidine kinase [Pseudomonadota bacterium]
MQSDERAKSFLQLINRSKRGRLKIYLGYSPGVGKTYAMLQEGKRLKAQGVDVMIGVVETHGRSDTEAQISNLEAISRLAIEYRGITIEEMDVKAILRRRPEIVLVDELAHTNAPDSPNAKRYQDVNDLLAAGIHVISTLNIQHLESLYNTVEHLVSIKVRERIPDSVALDADEIVNIDLTPQDLRSRLMEGKIYPEQRIASSLENFFQDSNLAHLRELTLREMASQIDFKRRITWDEAAPEQIMVCLASRGPDSAQLLRAASRLAGKLNRNWYAVYVQTPQESPTNIDSETQRILSETLTLANQLGATVFTLVGTDVAETIVGFVREYRVGHIVIGRPGKLSEWKRLFLRRQSIAERILAAASTATLVITPSFTRD